MEREDAEALTATLQAQMLVLSALIATHPTPARFLLAMMRAKTLAEPHPHPAYEETLNVLMAAIAET